MAVKKMTTVSIRVRQNTYTKLQQAAADKGLKMPDMIDLVVSEWASPPAVTDGAANDKDVVGGEKRVAPPEDNPPTSLPEFDVDGNPVAAWIRGL